MSAFILVMVLGSVGEGTIYHRQVVIVTEFSSESRCKAAAAKILGNPNRGRVVLAECLEK